MTRQPAAHRRHGTIAAFFTGDAEYVALSPPLTARDITRAVRRLFPAIRPLSTTRNLSPNGVVLSYTITMPEPAARNWGLTGGNWAPAGDWLTRQLGQPVHIADVDKSARRHGGWLVHITIETGKELNCNDRR